MKNAHSHFTATQRRTAKAENQIAKKHNPVLYKQGQLELLEAIATTKHSPNYNLKVIVA
jgi:hypothetical protein